MDTATQVFLFCTFLIPAAALGLAAGILILAVFAVLLQLFIKGARAMRREARSSSAKNGKLTIKK